MVQSNKRPLDNFGDPLSVSPDEIKVFAELIRLHKRKFADFLHNNLDFPEWDVSVESKFGMDG